MSFVTLTFSLSLIFCLDYDWLVPVRHPNGPVQLSKNHTLEFLHIDNVKDVNIFVKKLFQDSLD